MGMMNCPHCGARFVDWFDWCPYCKKRLDPIPVHTTCCGCLILFIVLVAILFVYY